MTTATKFRFHRSYSILRNAPPEQSESLPTSSPSREPFHYKPPSDLDLARQIYQDGSDRKYGSRKSEQYAMTFFRVPFTHFISIVPTYSVTIPQLVKMVERFVKKATYTWKKTHKGILELGYLVGYEIEPSRHLHMCLVSRPALSVEFVESIWKEIVGTNPKSVDVQPFDPSKRGVSYCFKQIDGDTFRESTYDYESHNLQGFIFKENARTRRDRKRPTYSPAAQALRQRFLKEKSNSNPR